jgi:hypothetical protein
MNKHLKLPLSVLLAVGAVATLSASIISLGPIILGGTGLGSVNTILTVQGTPTESGCVAWNGASDVVGPAACPGGISGGNEKTGASQTQTRSIAELGLVNAASIRIIMNANEPAANGITLDQLVLRIYDASTGAVLFSDSIPAAIIFPTTFSGTGSSGFGFALNAAQAAAAQSAFANTANRLGLSASASGTAGGGGTFFVANVTTIVTPTGCPTITLLPATLPNATVGVPYNQTIVGSGGTAPYTFTLTGGTLPAQPAPDAARPLDRNADDHGHARVHDPRDRRQWVLRGPLVHDHGPARGSDAAAGLRDRACPGTHTGRLRPAPATGAHRVLNCTDTQTTTD